ncbi:MAG: DNA alkylation repair protein [Candidatus Sericytochromatia bacterium]|nr:DNA alkylation repair protein [Candidatus Sericytochromatia bacterium]
MSSSGFSLKDQLFNPGKVQGLARDLQRADPAFDASAFTAEATAGLAARELKARIDWICSCLQRHLPADYPQAVALILKALPPPLDPTRTDDDFGDFIYTPYGEYIARYGCQAQHLDLSLDALHSLTRRFSVEGPIRVFLKAFPAQTLARLRQWQHDSNYHVRRLVSEGTRPRLPWYLRLDLPLSETLPLLETLHADKTRFVTRSVANHLNDISKTDPDTVLATLQHWQQLKRQQPAELTYITRHSLRSLIKQGYAGALQLLGYGQTPQLAQLQLQAMQQTLSIGDTLHFSLNLQAQPEAPPQHLLIDYWIDFQRAGNTPGRKVFKWKQLVLQPGQALQLEKRHAFKPMRTRRLWPGVHRLGLQVNGQAGPEIDFTLCSERSDS